MHLVFPKSTMYHEKEKNMNKELCCKMMTFVFISGWSLNRLKGFIERRKWVTGLSLFGWCYVVWPRGMDQSPSKWPKQYQLFTKLMTLSICVLSVLGQKAPSTLWMQLNGWVQHHLVTGKCNRHITKSGALTKWGRTPQNHHYNRLTH